MTRKACAGQVLSCDSFLSIPVVHLYESVDNVTVLQPAYCLFGSAFVSRSNGLDVSMGNTINADANQGTHVW